MNFKLTKGSFGLILKRIQKTLLLSIVDALVIYFAFLPFLALTGLIINLDFSSILVIMFFLNYYIGLMEIRELPVYIDTLYNTAQRTFNLVYYLSFDVISKNKTKEEEAKVPTDTESKIDIKD